MTRLTASLALSLLAATLSFSAPSAVSAANAMKSDAMMADCMKKAKMETDAMKMKSMEKDCKMHAMKAGAMGSDPMQSDTMMPKKKK